MKKKRFNMETEYLFIYLKDNNRLNTSYNTMILNLLKVLELISLQSTKHSLHQQIKTKLSIFFY